jgi:hypothetical protein
MQFPLPEDLLEIVVTKSKTNTKSNRAEVQETKTHFSVKINVTGTFESILKAIKSLFC